MKIIQDPRVPTRFVADYLITEQLFAGADDIEEPFTSEAMAKAFVPGEGDFFFHDFASAALSVDRPFAPVRDWLQTAKSEVCYQPVIGGVAYGEDDKPEVVVATHRFAMVFLDPGKAALFKMWVSGFNDEEQVRLGC